MGTFFSKDVSVAAASQFLGTELSVAPKSGSILRVREVNITFGSEAKSFTLVKKTKNGHEHVLLTSHDSDGVIGTTTNTSFWASGADVETYLLPGDQFQIKTVDATSAMHATVYFEELP